MPTLTEPDGVHVLVLGDDENRFAPAWMADLDEALDQVVNAPAPLVLTATGKFYSNGLDLDWLGGHPDQHAEYIAQVQGLFARVLTLPVPTVAAVNGHAFGAGAMLAMACDWRVMREDRGYFCLPEVDIRMPFMPGMAALVQCKLTPRAAVDAMTTGTRYAAPDALAAGIVDDIAAEAALTDAAVARVAHLTGKDRDTLGAIKDTMFADVVAALTEAAG